MQPGRPGGDYFPSLKKMYQIEYAARPSPMRIMTMSRLPAWYAISVCIPRPSP